MFDDKLKGIAQAYLSMHEKKKEVCEECGKVHEGMCEELSAKQKKIDHDKDGDIEADDLAAIRKKGAKKEAIDIVPSKKSDVNMSGKDKEGGDEEEDDDDDDMPKKKKNGMKVTKKDSKGEKGEKMETTKESTQWDWDAILDAPDDEVDALIDALSEDELVTFASEFNELQEAYNKATPGVKAADQEKLEPRAAAEKDFVAKHKKTDINNPELTKQDGSDKVKVAAPRPGDNKQGDKAMKTLKDIRK